MQNVIINTGCNLCCSYCFAEDFMSSNAHNMSIENFDKVIEYFKKNGIDSMRILGGEPTLAKNFTLFMTKLINDPFFRHIHIFSNGLFNKDVMDILLAAKSVKGISMLINFNHPDELDPIDKTYPNTKKVVSNITKLAKEGIIDGVGINIFRPDFDYSYATELMKKLDIKDLRFSVTVPNTDVESDFDVKAHYRSYMPLLMKLAKECDENKFVAHSDCNSFPKCIVTGDELRELSILGFDLCNRDKCSPVLDIQPNLEIIRCLGFSNSKRLMLDIDKKPYEYAKYYDENLDNLVKRKTLLDECIECPMYKRNGQSCGCLCYNGIK